jgi:hypothetical protein
MSLIFTFGFGVETRIRKRQIGLTRAAESFAASGVARERWRMENRAKWLISGSGKSGMAGEETAKPTSALGDKFLCDSWDRGVVPWIAPVAKEGADPWKS